MQHAKRSTTSYPTSWQLSVLLEMAMAQAKVQAVDSYRLGQIEAQLKLIGLSLASAPSWPAGSPPGAEQRQVHRLIAWGSLGLILLRLFPWATLILAAVWDFLLPWLRWLLG